MDNYVNLVKLSVGSESAESLAAWQEANRDRFADGLPRHVTRMWPKRESEILNGGSIFWVIKGVILCRQRVVRLDEVIGSDGIRRCGIVLDPHVIRTEAAPRRPFQGWRYLTATDAPADLGQSAAENAEDAPHQLLAALAEIGVR